MRVLAGDIGGTKTLLALAQIEGSRVHILQEKLFSSAPYPDFTSLAREFLLAAPAEAAPACFGVPGPVVAGRAPVTKLPWVLEETRLESELGLGRVRLINDFAAIARGIEALAPNDLAVLNPGSADPVGSMAVLGAGTGLGEALVVKAGGHPQVISGEGGTPTSPPATSWKSTSCAG